MVAEDAPHTLNWFTPLPPARNGIADYSAILLDEICGQVPSICYCDDAHAITPPGVEVRDPLQAYRHLSAQSRILHQIGNNGGHVFVLEALRRHGGVVSLHDLSLLYLYELASPSLQEVLAHMPGPTGQLGETFARHWRDARVKTAANYVLFDAVGEILARSRAMLVHSDYARRKLEAVHGAEACRHISVIPHFAPPLKIASHDAARHALGILPHETLILTSGFATKVKRFDWLIEALDRMIAMGHRFRWVHAGAERAEEYDLSAEIAKRPGLRAVASVTGYVSEEMLDTYICASDIVVNLRFPSVGESSGTLARAFSAGRCCVVNDTAAYAEIPRDVAVHVPVFDTVPALIRALDGLLATPELRDTFGQRARLFAQTELAMATVGRRYLEVIDAAYRSPARSAPGHRVAPAINLSGGPLLVDVGPAGELPDLDTLISAEPGRFEVHFAFASQDAFAAQMAREPDFLRRAFGAHVSVETVTFVPRAAAAQRKGRGRSADKVPDKAAAAGVCLAVTGLSHRWSAEA